MRKLHKGQTFQSLPLAEISSGVKLRCALYAFLPRNDRMLKVRDRGQFVEPSLLEGFARGGHDQLYTLDPFEHPEAHDQEPGPPLLALPLPAPALTIEVEPTTSEKGEEPGGDFSALPLEEAAKLFPAVSTDRRRHSAYEELAAEIREREERLEELSPSSRAFVEGLRRDSPSPANEPLARTGQQLRERLVQLREQSRSAAPEDRPKIREQIARTEAAMGLVRELQNHLSGPGERLAETAAVASEVIAQIAGLAEPSPIKEADRAALREIAETMRARAVLPADQPESVLGPELTSKLRALESDPGAMSEKEAKEVREAAAVRIRRAAAASETNEELAELRGALVVTLEEAPATPEEAAVLEERALGLQRKIAALEEQSLSLHREITGSEEGSSGSTPAELMAEAASLAKEASQQKAAARSAGDRLREKIFGEVALEPSAPSVKEENEISAHLPVLCAPDLAALDRVRAQVLAAEGSTDLEANLEPLREAVGKELRAARRIVNLESKLSRAEGTLAKLLGKKPGVEEERFEQETEILLLQKDIREMQNTREEIRRGTVLDPERLTAFEPPLLPETTAGSPAAELEQMRAELEETKLRMVQSAVAAARSADVLEQALGAHGSEEQKRDAVKCPGLERLHHVVGRRLRAFLESGKDPDPGEVWEINHLLAKKLGLARTEGNIARRITSLVAEHQALISASGGSNPERETRLKTISENLETLNSAAKALENGDLVDATVIAPFVEPAEPELHFSPDLPLEENQRRILAGIEEAQEELVRVKAGAMGAATVVRLQALPPEDPAPTSVFQGGKADHRLDEKILVRGGEVEESGGQDKLFSPDSPKEEAVTKLGSEGERDLQASVYAAALLRAFGYRSPELETDLILACLLWRAEDEKLSEGVPERVLLIHRAARAAHREGEMALRDLALAARLAREYLGMPGVVTGAFTFQPNLFDAFCTRVLASGLPVDRQLLERARQAVAFRLVERERDELLQLARHHKEKVDRWRQAS